MSSGTGDKIKGRIEKAAGSVFAIAKVASVAVLIFEVLSSPAEIARDLL